MRKPNLITHDPKHRLVGSSGQAELGEGAGTEAYEASVRRLTPCEVDELRRDMAEASAWARTELRKRRAAKNSRISWRGIIRGIALSIVFKFLI